MNTFFLAILFSSFVLVSCKTKRGDDSEVNYSNSAQNRYNTNTNTTGRKVLKVKGRVEWCDSHLTAEYDERAPREIILDGCARSYDSKSVNFRRVRVPVDYIGSETYGTDAEFPFKHDGHYFQVSFDKKFIANPLAKITPVESDRRNARKGRTTVLTQQIDTTTTNSNNRISTTGYDASRRNNNDFGPLCKDTDSQRFSVATYEPQDNLYTVRNHLSRYYDRTSLRTRKDRMICLITGAKYYVDRLTASASQTDKSIFLEYLDRLGDYIRVVERGRCVHSDNSVPSKLAEVARGRNLGSAAIQRAKDYIRERCITVYNPGGRNNIVSSSGLGTTCLGSNWTRESNGQPSFEYTGDTDSNVLVRSPYSRSRISRCRILDRNCRQVHQGGSFDINGGSAHILPLSREQVADAYFLACEKTDVRGGLSNQYWDNIRK